LNAPDPRRLIWTANCTAALNLALKGLLRAGDHVVTTQLEHNSVNRPLRSLEKQGVAVTRVACPSGGFDPARFLAAINSQTRLAVLTHASNVTGAVLPVAEIAAECRTRGVKVLVDAAQSAGVLEIDVRDMGVDLLAMPGHKGLYGPPGTGALYIAEGVELSPLLEGGTGTESESEEPPEKLPERFEAGTLNSAGIAALGAAVEWIAAIGVSEIGRDEALLAERLWQGLSEVAGVQLYGPPPGAPRVGVVSFTLAGWEPTDMAVVLDESFNIQCRPGLHCAPGAHRALGTFPSGTVRLSPGYFNTLDEADAVIAAVRELAGS
ncbi:MAG: aminotransferase class V-fold PLP-dependent enzyme, partial [Actinomycetota bacterium]